MDLISGSSLPNKAPYRMTLTKSEKVNRQVQELLDRGLVWEILSPRLSSFCTGYEENLWKSPPFNFLHIEVNPSHWLDHVCNNLAMPSSLQVQTLLIVDHVSFSHWIGTSLGNPPPLKF